MSARPSGPPLEKRGPRRLGSEDTALSDVSPRGKDGCRVTPLRRGPEWPIQRDRKWVGGLGEGEGHWWSVGTEAPSGELKVLGTNGGGDGRTCKRTRSLPPNCARGDG